MSRLSLALALAILSVEATSETSPKTQPPERSCNANITNTADCRCVYPSYPLKSRRKGEEGEVRLKVAVSASGAVQDVQIVRSSGYPRLDQASVDAVKQNCFRPAMGSDGKPMNGSTIVIYNWKLKDQIQ